MSESVSDAVSHAFVNVCVYEYSRGNDRTSEKQTKHAKQRRREAKRVCKHKERKGRKQEGKYYKLINSTQPWTFGPSFLITV